jgi:hypothetical protein
MRGVKKLFAIFCDNSQNIATYHKTHATCRSSHAICRSSYTTRRKKLQQVATRHNILRQVATGQDWSTTQLPFGLLTAFTPWNLLANHHHGDLGIVPNNNAISNLQTVADASSTLYQPLGSRAVAALQFSANTKRRPSPQRSGISLLAPLTTPRPL